MGDQILKIRHSSYYPALVRSSTSSGIYSNSDYEGSKRNNRPRVCASLGTRGQYYKRFEHDEIPVKDSGTHQPDLKSKNKGSLTNTDLERLETRIYSNVSQELQTDESSLCSLESQIQYFKMTMEMIFDNFYTNRRDFELYKKRFQAILDRSKDGFMDDMDEMEEFIKEMFEHMSSDNSNYVSPKISQKSTDTSTDLGLELEQRGPGNSSGSTSTGAYLSTGVLEAYKNDHYLTDSTIDENSPGGKKIEDVFNIFLLGSNPCVEIKPIDRNLISEINIGETSEKMLAGFIASADNIKKLAAKRLEVEQYVSQEQNEVANPDIDIPVKVSFAKKNIYLDEDFARNEGEAPRSFISKICNILCKRFRKSTFG